MSLAERLIARITRRAPDVVIGGHESPYMRRWFVIPRNPVFNVYLHQFLRSDDDRALHDHPWANLSILLSGHYREHTIAAGGVERVELFGAGDWRFRWTGRIAHRIELLTFADYIVTQPENRSPLSCWTLFITGPRYRSWGFHCPLAGWIHWERFVDDNDRGAIGKGCNQ